MLICTCIFQFVRYVSWNEFLYTMLTKGEVEELIVRPDIEVVTIILHEGAIIKGKKVSIILSICLYPIAF